MPATYTPLLRLTKPGLGDTGWGTTVNDGTTELVDTSVAGTASVDVTSGNVTLTTANGATDQARNMFLRVFGASVAREVIVPATSKLYFVVNDCTAAVTVKVSGQTGVAIPASSTAVVRCNGTDVVTSLNYAPSLTLGAALAAASGGTGQASYTTGDLLYATGATALSKLGIGTNGQILTSTGTAPQWSTLSGVAVTTFSAGTTGFTPNSATSGAVTLAGTLATTNGGTGLTSFTSGGVLYASSTSALATGSALTFDGTNFVVGGAAVFGKSTVINSLSGTAAALGISDNATTTMYANNVSSGVSALWSSGALAFGTNNGTFSEQMRLNSTGLGIGTSSPTNRLSVVAANAKQNITSSTGTNEVVLFLQNTGGDLYIGRENSAGTYFSAPAYSANLFSGGAYPMLFWTNSTERMRLDSSGNLGLGVTPSAWSGTNGGAFQFGGGRSSLYSYSNAITLGSNVYYDTINKYVVSGVASSAYQQLAGVHYWLTAPSGTAGNTISFTQAMTLDSSGNLGLGVTPNAWGGGYKALQVTAGVSLASNGANAGQVFQNAYFDGTNERYIGSFAASKYAQINGAHAWSVAPSGTAGNAISFTQAMTLDSSGNLGIGTSSPGTKLDVVGTIKATAAQGLLLDNSVGVYATIQYNGTSIGDIGTGNQVYSGGTTTDLGISARTGYRLVLGSNGVAQATLDASGNLGLGVTPSAWIIRGLQVASSSVANDVNDTYLTANGYFDGSWKYINSDFAAQYYQVNGVHAWRIAPSGTAGNAISFTQAMTLDAGGRLLVGRTTSTGNNERFQIDANGTSTVYTGYIANSGTSTSTYNVVRWEQGAAGSATGMIGTGGSAVANTAFQNTFVVGTQTYSALVFATADTERARIPAAGGMVVGTAALATTATDGFLYVPTCAGTPTGTPTTQTGTAPIVVDTTNNKLYFYSGGQWRDAGP